MAQEDTDAVLYLPREVMLRAEACMPPGYAQTRTWLEVNAPGRPMEWWEQ